MALPPGQIPQIALASAAGSQWQQTFTLTDSTGAPINLTGLTWEFVVRPSAADATEPPLVSVTTTASTQGQITVTPLTGTVTVTLTPAATTTLGKGLRPYGLWSDPATTTATCWVQGTYNTTLVASP